MKRLVIEGDWRLREVWWVLLDSDGETVIMRCRDGQQSSVEDIPDPLPTEPGVRFWGRCDEVGEDWWFVTAVDDTEVDYVCAQGWRMTPDRAAKMNLARLPDPE